MEILFKGMEERMICLGPREKRGTEINNARNICRSIVFKMRKKEE
jgi:hypothetical protein